MPSVVRKRKPVRPISDVEYARLARPVEHPEDVLDARFDKRLDALTLTLRNGVRIGLPRRHVRELANIDPREFGPISIQAGGDGISFPQVDVDIYVPGLIADELGTVFARAMGRRSRGKTSEKKAEASKKNGSRGGRPKRRPNLV